MCIIQLKTILTGADFFKFNLLFLRLLASRHFPLAHLHFIRNRKRNCSKTNRTGWTNFNGAAAPRNTGKKMLWTSLFTKSAGVKCNESMRTTHLNRSQLILALDSQDQDRCVWHQNKVVKQLVAITGSGALLVIRSICLEKSLSFTAAGRYSERKTGMQIVCFSFPPGGILPPVVFYVNSTWRDYLVSATAGNVGQIFIKIIKKKKVEWKDWNEHIPQLYMHLMKSQFE